MATADIQVPQGTTLVAFRLSTPDVRVPSGAVTSTINFPTPHMRAAQARALASVNADKHMRASQARVLVLGRGRLANPRVQAWTFTLDGHDFYVLRLGDDSTIVYDVSAKTWVEWDAFGNSYWPVLCGMDWIGGQRNAQRWGSSVIVGDDTFGFLWALGPELPYDQDPLYELRQNPFTREVTGQVIVRGRQAVPCYTIFLTGDNYGITAQDFVAGVTLQISDDQGRTFDPQDTIGVSIDTAKLPYEWYSLGQIEAPGRLFKIVDNGVFTRIDALDMNDAG